jgi:hypothetical protein
MTKIKRTKGQTTIYKTYDRFVVITIQSVSQSWLITGFVTRVTRWLPHVEQELLTLLEHFSSVPVFSGVGVAPSLVFCRMFCRSLFVLLSFLFLSLCFRRYEYKTGTIYPRKDTIPCIFSDLVRIRVARTYVIVLFYFPVVSNLHGFMPLYPLQVYSKAKIYTFKTWVWNVVW